MESIGALGSVLGSFGATGWSLAFGARPSAVQVGQVWMKIDPVMVARGPYVVEFSALPRAWGWRMKRLSDDAVVQMHEADRVAGNWVLFATAPVGAVNAYSALPSPGYVADDGPAVMETPLTYRTGASVVQCAPPRRGLARVAARVADAFDAGARWCQARAAKLRARGDR